MQSHGKCTLCLHSLLIMCCVEQLYMQQLQKAVAIILLVHLALRLWMLLWSIPLIPSSFLLIHLIKRGGWCFVSFVTYILIHSSEYAALLILLATPSKQLKCCCIYCICLLSQAEVYASEEQYIYVSAFRLPIRPAKCQTFCYLATLNMLPMSVHCYNLLAG